MKKNFASAAQACCMTNSETENTIKAGTSGTRPASSVTDDASDTAGTTYRMGQLPTVIRLNKQSYIGYRLHSSYIDRIAGYQA